jgi:hypothetical protein
MLGRVMNIVMFATMALMPFSEALAGALLRWNVEILFIGASVLMIRAAIYIYSSRDRYQIGDQLL